MSSLQDGSPIKPREVYSKGLVPATLYFLVDENHRIYGAIHIRHELNESLLFCGGHIGYGVRPSERRKGYATLMLQLVFPIVKSLGINQALITCNKTNLASASTIVKNGGVLENEVLYKGELVQRYWVPVC